MSERWEEARADLEEERRRALAAGEVLPVLEDSTVTGLPFTPSRYPVETWRLLDEWQPRGESTLDAGPVQHRGPVARHGR